MPRTNEFGQPIGDPVSGWNGCPQPGDVTLTGRACRLERINVAKHADDLFAVYSQSDGRMWTYMLEEPFTKIEEFHEYMDRCARSTDPRHYTVIDLATSKAIGTMSLMRIDPKNGVIEVGFVTFSPLLQRSTHSTEAQFLLMAYVFDELGYRRYEWKCDSLNEPSRKAAERLGFIFEGIFHGDRVYKGRNRDTAWFAITVDRWPKLKAEFEAWLSLDNFDSQGHQIKSLAELRK